MTLEQAFWLTKCNTMALFVLDDMGISVRFLGKFESDDGHARTVHAALKEFFELSPAAGLSMPRFISYWHCFLSCISQASQWRDEMLEPFALVISQHSDYNDFIAIGLEEVHTSVERWPKIANVTLARPHDLEPLLKLQDEHVKWLQEGHHSSVGRAAVS